jgi:16S rRNA C967 or C1407 C5-methylase (RsmB/RsmF family)
VKKETVLEAFSRLWSDLFSSPVHLDSLLSKQPKTAKSSLARMVTPILLRPVSESESFGIGVSPGEPWSFSKEKLAEWRTSRLLADRIYASLSNPPQSAAPMNEDFPPHMIREWKEDWGDGVSRNLVSVLGREAPLGIRAARKLGAAELVRQLKSTSSIPVKIEASPISPVGVRLGGYAQVFNIPAYEEGGFEIQDEGSQIMALFALWPELYAGLLTAQPGPVEVSGKIPAVPSPTQVLNVVDACAGAGGKSLALADLLKGKGRVYSYDISATKLQALRRRATRAGLTSIQTVALEEGKEIESLTKFHRSADLVLVDAPCSGWGVIRRNPDIKWRQDLNQLKKMPEIQTRLLGDYSELVKPGGRLVFGVCTFRKSETLDVVLKFLETHPDFQAGPGGFLGPGPTDGFFMQSFDRRALETLTERRGKA